MINIIEGNYLKLGVTKEKKGMNFALAVRGKHEKVRLLLYKKGDNQVMEAIAFPLEYRLGNVYAMNIIPRDWKNLEYNYEIDGKVVQDPYGKIITGREEFGVLPEKDHGHEIRCGFLLEDYDWGNDKKIRRPYEDVVAYQMHVRGFTKQAGSGIKHKGTFLGIQEKLSYLKELGINLVKLMPVYEFPEVKEPQSFASMTYQKPEEVKSAINYWGYGPGFYFAPKASYGAGKNPVKEFKDFVKVMHENDMEVVLEFAFSEEIQVRQASDCLLYWMLEYHIDGFHLMADAGLCKQLAKDPLLSEVKLFGVYFPTDEIYPYNEQPAQKNLAECNDGFLMDIRKLLKGDEDQLNSFVYRIRKNPTGSGVINYITNHDGFSLHDLVSYDEKHNEENGEQNRDGSSYNYSWNCGIEGKTRRKKILELRQQQMCNGFLMMLLSQGTPMLLAGDEFANEQGGNNNPYCQDNEISWVDWKGLKRNGALMEFVKKAIAFRKCHKILHLPTELQVMDTVSCGYPDVSYHSSRAWYGAFEHNNRQIGVMYCGLYAKEEQFLYVAYNMHWVEHEFALPHMPEGMQWHLAMDTGKSWLEKIAAQGEEKLLEEQQMMTTAPRTIVVLIGKKVKQQRGRA